VHDYILPDVSDYIVQVSKLVVRILFYIINCTYFIHTKYVFLMNSQIQIGYKSVYESLINLKFIDPSLKYASSYLNPIHLHDNNASCK
jgi:hypothetical protein